MTEKKKRTLGRAALIAVYKKGEPDAFRRIQPTDFSFYGSRFGKFKSTYKGEL